MASHWDDDFCIMTNSFAASGDTFPRPPKGHCQTCSPHSVCAHKALSLSLVSYHRFVLVARHAIRVLQNKDGGAVKYQWNMNLLHLNNLRLPITLKIAYYRVFVSAVGCWGWSSLARYETIWNDYPLIKVTNQPQPTTEQDHRRTSWVAAWSNFLNISPFVKRN